MYRIYLNRSNGDFVYLTSTDTLNNAKEYCKDYVKGHKVFKWGENDKANRFSLEVYEDDYDNQGCLLDYIYATKMYIDDIK